MLLLLSHRWREFELNMANTNKINGMSLPQTFSQCIIISMVAPNVNTDTHAHIHPNHPCRTLVTQIITRSAHYNVHLISAALKFDATQTIHTTRAEPFPYRNEFEFWISMSLWRKPFSTCCIFFGLISCICLHCMASICYSPCTVFLISIFFIDERNDFPSYIIMTNKLPI